MFSKKPSLELKIILLSNKIGKILLEIAISQFKEPFVEFIEKVDNALLKTISLFWLTAAEEKKRSTGWSVLIAVKLNNQLIFRFL